MHAVLSKLRRGLIARLGASIAIGVSSFAVSAKVLPALPQLDDARSFDARYLEPAVFIDDSQHAMRMRQDVVTHSDQQAPLFGMEAEPVAGELAAKWRAVKTDIDHEKQVLARCGAQEICPAVAQELLHIVAEGSSSCETSFTRKIMRP